MTSRSIVFSTAALLLLSAATPVQLGFSPTAAVAQEVSAEVRAALTGDPAGLEAAELSERIRVLRDAIESGALKGPDRKAARDKVKAYREVLKQLRDERKEARQEGQQPEEPAAGQRTQSQQGDQQAEQQARQAERKAERQAERQAEQQARQAERQAQQDERQAEQQAREAERQAKQQQRQAERQAQQQEQAQQQAQQPAQQQAQQPAQQQAQASGDSGLSEEARAALRDTRPAEELPPAELRDRIQVLRGILQSAPLNQEQRSEVQARMQADREVLRSRRDERQQQAEPEQGQREQVQTQEAEPEQAEPEQAQTRERQPRQTRAEAIPEAEVEERAQEIMSDNRPADDLDDQALRRRLTENRAILETGKLSRAEVRELRQQLRADREELRGRVAARQEEDDDEPASGATSSSTSTSTSSTEVTTTTNVNVIIEQQTPPDRLSERELERRVRALNRALKEERLARRDAEIARAIVERDRLELSRRLHAERDRRRDRWRDARNRDELFIEFNVGYQPPPVIFAAEAMQHDIEMQLVAPPTRQMTRAYSLQEIASNQDVREMMPGIEIDTLNFDFGSAEVRPEEIDKLDAIAEVIERIVAARPDEVFLIEGHTDAVGSDAANDVLSQRRSQAVAEALLDYYAIDPANLQTVGLGEQYLKIWTEEPEEENRRVTIRRITPLLAGGQG